MGQWNSRGYVKFHDKLTSGIWTPPDNDPIPYDYYAVEAEDAGRLDSIAFKVYGYEAYFWIIAAFNNITDPFNGISVGQTLKIPNLNEYLKAHAAAGFIQVNTNDQ